MQIVIQPMNNANVGQPTAGQVLQTQDGQTLVYQPLQAAAQTPQTIQIQGLGMWLKSSCL